MEKLNSHSLRPAMKDDVVVVMMKILRRFQKITTVGTWSELSRHGGDIDENC